MADSTNRKESPYDLTQLKGLKGKQGVKWLAFAALGIVYGDIGTSPLYAIKESFYAFHLVPSSDNVLGILSLIFWSLTLVVVVKYLTFVMRAENNGEGGILALLALVQRFSNRGHLAHAVGLFVFLGVAGTALLFADGVITPAISVLSAVEGLTMISPKFSSIVMPCSLVVLILLFLFQRRGTAGVASIFSPLMLLWFVTMAVIGIPWIIKSPIILLALNPYHAIHFFVQHGIGSISILGAVVLCITGAEALYADVGHFGRKAISRAWYIVVYPSLICNYFGQGAVILHEGSSALRNPFFSLVPVWGLYPLVILATVATVIASQALISGAFSLAQQAVQLGYTPRLTIVHTSSQTRGQIYVPEINTMLMILCVLVVLFFRNSSNLAEAYGVAVTGTMIITSILILPVTRNTWKWSKWRSALLTIFFLCFDLPFFIGNIFKIKEGGWFPLLFGSILVIIMLTWKRGRLHLAATLKERFVKIEDFIKKITEEKDFVRVKGTSVFMTQNLDVVPPALIHHYTHNHVLHDRVIMLAITTEDVPKVEQEHKLLVKNLGFDIYQVVAHFGFMESPKIPEILRDLGAIMGQAIEINETSFYLGRETLIISRKQKDMAQWRKSLFIFLAKNAKTATSYFRIPVNRVVEMGMQVEF